MDYTKILLRPVVTEKATLLRDSASQFAFFVDPKVVDVNVVTVKPRNRVRQGRVKGRIPGYRKAYVTLAPGDKIEFFEGV